MEKVDNKKFTEEELKEIRTIKDGMANISQILGQIRLQQIQIEKIDEALKALDKDLQLLGADQMLLNDRLKQINADHETLFKTDLYQKSDSMLSGEKRKY